MNHAQFLNQLDDSRIVRAIADAEGKSSGEIRVFITKQRPATGEEALALAKTTFERLEMSKTKYRNGVLLLFAPGTQQFAILGDSGVHERCGDLFWQDLARRMGSFLKAGNFTDAVVAGIEDSGALLAKHFPRDPDDRDELPNTVARD
jgi:uncharacterized membrane protein